MSIIKLILTSSFVFSLNLSHALPNKAELFDFVKQDVSMWFPDLAPMVFAKNFEISFDVKNKLCFKLACGACIGALDCC